MIKVENVSKNFEDIKALSNITCTITDGSIYGLVGSNGAGKSTLLRILTGVYKESSGSVTYDDKPIYNNPKVKEQIVFVPDDSYFIRGANLKRMGKLYKNVYKGFDEEKLLSLATNLKLDTKKDISSFSKGMKRLSAILFALSTNAKYIFMDESLDGLDPVMRNAVKKLICAEICDRQASVIVTSHSLRELEDFCDSLALLHKGSLVLESNVEELKSSLLKVQVAFGEEITQEDLKKLQILKFAKQGKLIELIIKGNQEEVTNKLNELSPVILEVLPLTLEEVFTYEMETLGYEFNEALEGTENEE